MDWYTWNLVQLFAISTMFMAIAAGNVTRANLYASIVTILYAVVIINLFMDFTVFEYVSTIVVAIFYDLLWAASVEAGLNIYSISLNAAIGIILALILWMLYDNVRPTKRVWNKKIISKKVAAISMTLLLLVATGAFIYVMFAILSFDLSIINFAIMLFGVGFFVYYTLEAFDAAKEYLEKEKGGMNGKPKPKPK